MRFLQVKQISVVMFLQYFP